MTSVLFDRNKYNIVLSNYDIFHQQKAANVKGDYLTATSNRQVWRMVSPSKFPPKHVQLDSGQSELITHMEDLYLDYIVNCNFRSHNWTPISSHFSRDGLHPSDAGKVPTDEKEPQIWNLLYH